MSENFKNIRKISNIPENCRERYLPLYQEAAQVLISNGINFSGISKLRSGYQIGSLEPAVRHMIIFTQAGAGYLLTKSTSYKLAPGTLISVPSGHSCMFGVCEDQWDILWFYLLDIPDWTPLKNKGIEFKTTNFIPKLKISMEGYLSETQTDPPGKAASLFAELIVCYLDQALEIFHEKNVDETKNKLDMIWQQILENPAKSWTKTEMAKKLHVSPSTFDRIVKKYYDTTPWQKVIQIRMEQAKMLLIKTDYPLQVIAERLGYANEFIFSAAFKHYAAISPKYYRHKKSLPDLEGF